MSEHQDPWMAEIEELGKFPELAGYSFPFRGHPDFRGFTDDDYAHFPGGIFVKVHDARQAKWFGGEALADAAEAKLIELGYAVTRDQSKRDLGGHWIDLLFTPKSVPADYVPKIEEQL
jgi:hypothetical protein